MRPKRRLGVVQHISGNSGSLILRDELKANIGERVVDGEGAAVGAVFDIFGPVSAPFIAVRPEVERPERYIGEPLYLRRS